VWLAWRRAGWWSLACGGVTVAEGRGRAGGDCVHGEGGEAASMGARWCAGGLVEEDGDDVLALDQRGGWLQGGAVVEGWRV